MATIIIAVLLGLSLAMAGAWVMQRRTGQSGWADVVWSYEVGVAGAILSVLPLLQEGLTARQLLVAAMVAVWSLRLGSHILVRTWGGPDDPRYAQLRQGWGAQAAWRMFWFLQIQAAMAMLLVLCVMAAAHNPRPFLDWRDGIGLVIMIVAIVGETLADRQLRAFASDAKNKGEVCTRGFWRWSRHPNYFFEWLGWWAYPVIAIDGSTAYAWGWFALVAPVLMYWLLVHASGIPPLEKHMLRSRGEKFRAYQARTNAFFPFPPKAP